MNKPLLDSIKNALSTSTGCQYVFYSHLPNKELLKIFTITYEVQNPSNVQTYEDKEAIKVYTLKVNLNAPQLYDLETKAEKVKAGIYSLSGSAGKIKIVLLTDEQTFWDSELSIYTEYLNFEIHYS